MGLSSPSPVSGNTTGATPPLRPVDAPVHFGALLRHGLRGDSLALQKDLHALRETLDPLDARILDRIATALERKETSAPILVATNLAPVHLNAAARRQALSWMRNAQWAPAGIRFAHLDCNEEVICPESWLVSSRPVRTGKSLSLSLPSRPLVSDLLLAATELAEAEGIPFLCLTNSDIAFPPLFFAVAEALMAEGLSTLSFSRNDIDLEASDWADHLGLIRNGGADVFLLPLDVARDVAREMDGFLLGEPAWDNVLVGILGEREDSFAVKNVPGICLHPAHERQWSPERPGARHNHDLARSRHAEVLGRVWLYLTELNHWIGQRHRLPTFAEALTGWRTAFPRT